MRIITLLLASSLSIFAADCDGSFQLDATHTTVQFNNQTKACANWQVSDFVAGFSAASVQFESAPNGANGNVPGAWVAFAGTTISGSNPMTAVTTNTSVFAGVFPWVRVRLVSQTGTGTISGRMLGVQLTSASLGFSPSISSTMSWPFHSDSQSLYSWNNQAAYTDTSNAAISPPHRVLFTPTGAANNLTIRERVNTLQAAPPWTYEIAIMPLIGRFVNFPVVGICIGDSGTNRHQIFGPSPANATTFYGQTWTTPTVFSGFLMNGVAWGPRGGWLFLRFTNDGANEHLLTSTDGDAFQEQFTQASGTFVATQNEVGYCSMDGNASFPWGVTVYHECLYAGSGVPLGTAACI